tara:strand:- start:421 stop:801 length:381 start_codon:yes stop_codon:yes gene_type:complete
MQLEKLTQDWRLAKAREEAARDERVSIENEILVLHPAKEEGAETFITGGGARVTLTGKVTYKVNIEALQLITASWPADVRPIRTKVEADEAKLRAMRAEVPKLWLQIAPAIETRPAKTNVSIKFAE